jgi:hypothetical protein
MQLRPVQALGLDFLKAQLNGRIAVALDRFDLGHKTGASFDYCDRNDLTSRVKYLGHPDLFA